MMQKLIRTFAILCAFSIIITGKSEPAQQSPSNHTIINGEVLEELSSNPIDSVKIVLLRSPGLNNYLGAREIETHYTNEEGKFKIDIYFTPIQGDGCCFWLYYYKEGYYGGFIYDVDEGDTNDITIYTKIYVT